ncbi:MAG: NAD-dependent epimerase/dehydratase family protein [Candidatus Hydrogenedentota bacterium]|nr:MAG: NAD-dependent epimerase/dehydratase family protein [Candidatus Hydrogenedentota bacterium]
MGVNEKKRILLIGGSGLLGRELRRLAPDLIAPSRSELDLIRLDVLPEALDHYAPAIVIHAGAMTKTEAVRSKPAEAVITNIAATAVIASAALRAGFRLVYISSDYVYDGDRDGPHSETEPLKPGNPYAWTKLGGECAVRLVPDSLIIRTSFGPRPFEYAQGATDKITSRLYVDEAAPILLALAQSDLRGVINVGGKRRSLYDYALETRPDVQPIRLADLEYPVPRDTSLDLTRLEEWKAKEANELTGRS